MKREFLVCLDDIGLTNTLADILDFSIPKDSKYKVEKIIVTVEMDDTKERKRPHVDWQLEVEAGEI